MRQVTEFAIKPAGAAENPGAGGKEDRETGYLWLEALHIAFMVTWFAGLFYLPGLFICHAEAAEDPQRERFTVMVRRLFVIMTIGALLTAVFGAIMLLVNGALLKQGWFRVKSLLLVGMLVYHLRCRRWVRLLADGRMPDGARWLRWFNEIPVLFLLGIICLAVVRPF